MIVVMTFVFAFIIDQVKSVFTHAIIYIVVVRRFGYLKENEKEFVLLENLRVKRENGILKLQAFILKILESTGFETISLANIAVYTLFILSDLTLADVLHFNPTLIAKIDRVFLWIFAVEIILKTFASSG